MRFIVDLSKNRATIHGAISITIPRGALSGNMSFNPKSQWDFMVSWVLRFKVWSSLLMVILGEIKQRTTKQYPLLFQDKYSESLNMNSQQDFLLSSVLDLVFDRVFLCAS